jgi:ATP-dependent exoDNAse (exonuclease V) beta subunit
MTFTRKAAAEMRSRIVEAIEDADSTTPPRNAVHARTRQLAQWAARHAADREWELERNPSRLRILTIDGLNRQLAAATPIAAGGIGDFAVIEHPDRLLREVARATLIDAERDPVLQAHSDTVLRHLGNRWERAEELLVEMLRHRGRWLRHLMRDGLANLRSITERNLEVIVAAEIDAAHGSARSSGHRRRCTTRGVRVRRACRPSHPIRNAVKTPPLSAVPIVRQTAHR